jgi:phospholipid-translocating ATPase
MSVIVRTPQNEILLICKGADSVIEKRLYPGQDLLETTKSYLD